MTRRKPSRLTTGRLQLLRLFSTLLPLTVIANFECFYEKVVKVKADVAAHLTFLVLSGLGHISTENFALGATTGKSVDPQHPPFCVFSAYSVRLMLVFFRAA